MGHSFISEIGIAILAAAAFGLIFQKLRFPLITAYIAAGLAIGPSMGLGLVSNAHNIEMLSEIGFILLMFTLGIEIDLKRLKHAGKTLFVTGIAQVVFSFVLVFVLFTGMRLGNFGGDFGNLYIAMAASLSSTVIIVKTLSDRLEMGVLSSRITVGIAILQDIAAILFIAFQPSYSNLEWMILLTSLGKILLLSILCYGVSRYILPHAFKQIEQRPELIIITAVAWCFAMTSFSHSLKLSKEMGALIAGISIASLPYHADIASKLLSLRDFFITLFFVALGLQLPIPTHAEANVILILTVCIYVTRFVSIMPSLHLMGYGTRTAFVTSINLSQISEFGIILVTLGMKYDHVNSSLLNVFIWSFVFTSFLSSVTMPNYEKIFQFFNPILSRIFIVKDSEPVKTPDGQQTFIMTFLGLHHTSSSIIRRLEETHSKEFTKQIQIIDNNPEVLRTLKKEGFTSHYADLSHPATILNFNLHHSEIIISSVPDTLLRGTNNLNLLKFVKQHAPKALIITTAETIQQAKKHYAAGAHYVIIPRFVTASYTVDVIERLRLGETESVRNNASDYVNKIVEILP